MRTLPGGFLRLDPRFPCCREVTRCDTIHHEFLGYRTSGRTTDSSPRAERALHRGLGALEAARTLSGVRRHVAEPRRRGGGGMR